jgi:hypothetical protein
VVFQIFFKKMIKTLETYEYFLTTLLKSVTFLIMEELTITEISDVLSLNKKTTWARLKNAGIRPVRMVGTTAIYSPDVVEQIRTARPAHRPPKKSAE